MVMFPALLLQEEVELGFLGSLLLGYSPQEAENLAPIFSCQRRRAICPALVSLSAVGRHELTAGIP